MLISPAFFVLLQTHMMYIMKKSIPGILGPEMLNGYAVGARK